MTKAELLQRLREARAALQSVVDRIPRERLEEPYAVGDWSARDILGHIATWDEEDVKIIRGLEAGGSLPTYPDGFNDIEVGKQRCLRLEEVLGLYAGNHRRATEFFQRLPEHALQQPDILRMAMEHVDHYHQHQQDLEQWLSKA